MFLPSLVLGTFIYVLICCVLPAYVTTMMMRWRTSRWRVIQELLVILLSTHDFLYLSAYDVPVTPVFRTCSSELSEVRESIFHNFERLKYYNFDSAVAGDYVNFSFER